MPVPIHMPKFGMVMEEGKLLRWLRRDGEAVEQGDAVAEVETDKAVMEVEAPATGVLGPPLVPIGQTVPVAGVMAYVLSPGESVRGPSIAVESEPSSGEALLRVRLDVTAALARLRSRGGSEEDLEALARRAAGGQAACLHLEPLEWRTEPGGPSGVSLRALLVLEAKGAAACQVLASAAGALSQAGE